MEQNFLNSNPDALPSESLAADNQPKRTKTMSAAALAANRANALKSTGPRTAAGKLKAASNSFQHGIYSVENFNNFVANNDLALEIATNYIEQFNPVTPVEHTLVQQLIHFELRFLQMQALYNKHFQPFASDTLPEPGKFLMHILRELDRLPNRILKTIKAIRAEQALRSAPPPEPLEKFEIEPIPDQPALLQPETSNATAEPATPQRITSQDLLNLFAYHVLPPKSDETNPSS